MKRIKNIVEYLEENSKVVAVDNHTYTLANGDVVEHQFELDDDVTVEQFQQLLDNAKDTITGIMEADCQ